MSRETLALSLPDLRSLVGMPEALKLVDDAYRRFATGKAAAVPRSRGVVSSKKRALLLQGGEIQLDSGEYVACKVSGGGQGVITLHDPYTNHPLAIMDCTYISGLRTGANGALSAKYLARPNSRTVAVYGAGLQARSGLVALKQLFPGLEKVWAFSRTKANRDEYATTMTRVLGIPVEAVESAEAAAAQADIIYMATRADEPVITRKMVRPGTHISCVGKAHEISLDLLKGTKLVVDNYVDPLSRDKTAAFIKSGELQLSDIYADMAELASGAKPGRTDDAEITVLDSSGMAILDVAMSAFIYEAAIRAGVGTKVYISPAQSSDKYPY